MTAEELRSRLAAHLRTHLEHHPTGQLHATETGFTLSRPDCVRGPDLVVEVLNPDDRTRQIQKKVGEWLNAGALLVWVVDPRRESTHVYRADGTEEFIGSEGSLNGEEVLPGFTCPLKNIM